MMARLAERTQIGTMAQDKPSDYRMTVSLVYGHDREGLNTTAVDLLVICQGRRWFISDRQNLGSLFATQAVQVLIAEIILQRV